MLTLAKLSNMKTFGFEGMSAQEWWGDLLLLVQLLYYHNNSPGCFQY